MKTLEKIFAEKLLRVKAIKLQPENPFTWASGWKSPFYCDNRKTLSYPDLRSFVKIELARIILEEFPKADAVAGVATGAIPQGALVADALGLPFVYVRSKPKDHGLENLIEGELKPGMRVVVVEDLVSTGGSSLKAVEAIRQNGCDVVGMVASYTYGFAVATEAFKQAGVRLITLTNYDAAHRLHHRSPGAPAPRVAPRPGTLALPHQPLPRRGYQSSIIIQLKQSSPRL